MKILEADASALINFEVLDFLRSRGAAKDLTWVLASVAPSEFKVYDYLENSAACSQTRESITEIFGKYKKYNLTKSEIVNIVNVRPSSVVEIEPVTLSEFFPSPPSFTKCTLNHFGIIKICKKNGLFNPLNSISWYSMSMDTGNMIKFICICFKLFEY